MSRISTRLESASLLFLSELRTTRDLLYQPQLMVVEVVLGAILSHAGLGIERAGRSARMFATGLFAHPGILDCARTSDRSRRGYLRRVRPPLLHAKVGILDGSHSGNRRAESSKSRGGARYLRASTLEGWGCPLGNDVV